MLTVLVCLSLAEEAEQTAREPVLRLNPAEVSLKKGQSVKIVPSADNLPRGVKAGKYEWTSSDPQVAEHRNGTVRATGGGQATLTCSVTLTDGTRLSAECTVTVSVPVSGISFPSQSVTVMAGDSFVPDIKVSPEDATNPQVVFSSSDEQIISVGEGGQVTAVSEGKAYLTAASEDHPDKKARITVTVTRRIGKADRELTFLGIPWESDCETCFSLLREKGFVSPEAKAVIYTGNVWFWPENDLLFSRNSAWKKQMNAGARSPVIPQKTIGGYLPQTSTLIFLKGKKDDGSIDEESSRLTGVYFRFDSTQEKGTVIFCELLKRLEEQYGEFNRYLCGDIPRYYQSLYEEIKTAMDGAAQYSIRESGYDGYLEEYAICTIRGTGHTGIMLNMDTSGTVTLFYGRTDAADMIRELEEATPAESGAMEDAGV